MFNFVEREVYFFGKLEEVFVKLFTIHSVYHDNLCKHLFKHHMEDSNVQNERQLQFSDFDYVFLKK